MRRTMLLVLCAVLALCQAAGAASAAGTAASALPGMSKAAPAAVPAQAAKADTAVLKAVTGTVKVIPAGQKAAVEAKQGAVLSAKDAVETGVNSTASLVMYEGTELRLNQNTHFAFDTLDPKQNKATVTKGQLWASVIKGTKISFKLPTCTVAVRGTEIDINILDNGESKITLYSGIVGIINQFGEQVVTSAKSAPGNCQQVTVKATEAPSAPVTMKVETVSQWQKQLGPVAKEPEKKEEVKPKKEEKKEVKGEEKTEKTEKQELKQDKETVEDTQNPVIIPEPQQPPVEEASPSAPK